MKKKNNSTVSFLNETDDKGLFKAFIPFVKRNGNFVIEKSIGEGDDSSQSYYFIGEASNTQVDKGDDRMSKNFIKSMKTQLLGVNVFAEHEHEIEKTLGYVSDTSGSEDSVTVETALEDPEDNPLVKSILKKAAHGTKMYYSVLGKITKAVRKMDDGLKKMVREIEDGVIYEVSITALPEGNVSFSEPIMKSFKTFMKSVDPDGMEINDESDDDIENASEADISKALQEMMQSDGINNMIYDLFYAFRRAIYDITNNDDLTPMEKKEKIMSLSTEYGSEVEKLSTQLADLTEKINEQMSGESSDDDAT